MDATHRTIRLPLKFLTDQQWIELRRLAYKCASYGNTLLTEQYATAKGLKAEFTTYTDFSPDLSAAIRDAVGREVIGIWRRIGRKILRGEQTLARFDASRALVCRDRGVRLKQDGDGNYSVLLRLQPQANGTATEFKLYMPAVRRVHYLSETLERLRDEIYPITKSTVIFERPGRRVFVLLSFEKPVIEQKTEGGSAEVTLLEGVLRASANGRTISFADEIYRIATMKQNFSAIRDRLRKSLNKRGRRGRFREVLVKTQTFDNWVQGPLHQLSRKIIEWTVKEGAKEIQWQVSENGILPLDHLSRLVEYKAVEAGLAFANLAAKKANEKVAKKNKDGTKEDIEKKGGN